MATKTLYERARTSHLACNTFWMLLGQGARIPIQAIYFIFITRSLGAKGYGTFAGVTALVAILAPFAGIGSGNILIKNVSRNQQSFQTYWGKALVFTFISGIILILVALLFSMIILPSSISFALILSISIADLIFTRLLDISTQAYQAFERLDRTSQLMVLPNVMRLVLLGLLILVTQTQTPVIWGYYYLIGISISAFIGIFLVSKELGKPIICRKMLFTEVKEGIYFSISLSSQNIYNDLDKTMLTRLATLEATGIYSAAYRIIDVSFTPVRSLLYASYARFFQSGVTGIRGTLSYALKLIPYSLGYGFIISLALYILAPFLPYVLGSEFKDAVFALRYLSPLPLIKSMHYFAADSLTGAGFQGIRSVCQLSTAVLNILLILWLIPSYSWKGAAWASLASDSALLFLMIISICWVSYTQDRSIKNTN